MSIPKSVRKALMGAIDVLDADPQKEYIESGFRSDSPLVEIQMAKACRILNLVQRLVDEKYYTASIELSFAVIERSIHAYLLSKGIVEEDDFLSHHNIVEKAGPPGGGLLDKDMMEKLIELQKRHRSRIYYREGIPTKQTAEAMLDLAIKVHKFVGNADKELSRMCTCSLT